jgi:hypothetical protein
MNGGRWSEGAGTGGEGPASKIELQGLEGLEAKVR